jgi:hypothetical protein
MWYAGSPLETAVCLYSQEEQRLPLISSWLLCRYFGDKKESRYWRSLRTREQSYGEIAKCRIMEWPDTDGHIFALISWPPWTRAEDFPREIGALC